MFDPLVKFSADLAEITHATVPFFEAIVEKRSLQADGLIHGEVCQIAPGLYQPTFVFRVEKADHWRDDIMVTGLVFNRSFLAGWHEPYTKKAIRAKKRPPRPELFVLASTLRYDRATPNYHTNLYYGRPFYSVRWGREETDQGEALPAEELASLLSQKWRFSFGADELVTGELKLIRGKSERLRFYHRVGLNSADMEEPEKVIDQATFTGPRHYSVVNQAMIAKLAIAQETARMEDVAKAYRSKRKS